MTCQVQGIPIHYERHGEGKPILCIHGYWVDHRLMTGCLEPVFERMQGYQRIYLDLPGMGKTPAKESIRNADDMLEIVIEFINKLIPGERFLLIGESFGGYLALGLMLRMRKVIDGVMLVCPLINPKKRTLPERRVVWQSEALRDASADSDLNSFLEMAVIATPEIYEKYKNDILSGIRVADKDFLSNHFDGTFSRDFEAAVMFNGFDNPMCILTGRQDHVVGYADAFAILDRFPRATFAILDCAGHNLQIDNECVFEHMLRDWIWRIALTRTSNSM